MRGLKAVAPPPEYVISRDIACPQCGCNACEIIEYPRESENWFQQRAGKARCDHCRVQFGVMYEELDG